MNDVYTTPKVSVIMPVFNGAKYLKESVSSILNQTHTNFEFLIINDGSTDLSVKIINDFKNDRIQLINNPVNMGIVRSLNKGIDLARGEFIARMDSDDIAHPERLELQVNYLLKNPDCSVIASTVTQIDSTNNPLPDWEDDVKNTTRASIRERLPSSNCLAHPSVMIRSQVIKKNRYNFLAQHAEDYELWLRLSSQGLNIDKLAMPLIQYRVHPDSLTKKAKAAQGGVWRKGAQAKVIFLFSSVLKLRWSKLESMTLKSLMKSFFSALSRSIKAWAFKFRKILIGNKYVN